jgi:hypothetical protein
MLSPDNTGGCLAARSRGCRVEQCSGGKGCRCNDCGKNMYPYLYLYTFVNQKKSPSCLLPEDSLFCIRRPILALLFLRRFWRECKGRSSDFRIILLTAPSRSLEQWPLQFSFPVTAAGPCPLRIFPVSPSSFEHRKPLHRSNIQFLNCLFSSSRQQKSLRLRLESEGLANYKVSSFL